MSIDCQKCDGESPCSRCGGYGIIAVKRVACTQCKVEAWFKPGVATMYDGKRYESFDGLQLIYRTGGESVCEGCEHEAL